MSLDVELARFVLLVSVIVVAVLYVRTQQVTGGTFTPGYVAILLFAGEWAVLGSRAAEVRSLARRVRFTPQPVIARDELRVWMY